MVLGISHPVHQAHDWGPHQIALMLGRAVRAVLLDGVLLVHPIRSCLLLESCIRRRWYMYLTKLGCLLTCNSKAFPDFLFPSDNWTLCGRKKKNVSSNGAEEEEGALERRGLVAGGPSRPGPWVG